MAITIAAVDRFDDLAELKRILQEYLAPVVAEMNRRAGLSLSVEELLSATMSNLAAHLPPEGCSLLARDDQGFLMGTAFLKLLRPGTA